jgi:anti-sigma B factor antagonist
MSLFYIVDEPIGSDEGDVVLLRAGGELDYAAAPQLKERIDEHCQAGACQIVLDVSSATFIDSTAVGVIAGALARLDESGDGSLTIICEQENKRVLRIFDIAGVGSLLDIYDTREEALSALAATG